MSLLADNRALEVTTDLGPDLVVQGFSGTESISAPFAFQVDMVSEDPNLDTQSLLRTPIAVKMELETGEHRTIHGMVSRVTQTGYREGIASYRADMVPWLWFLGLNQDSRVFQGKTVLEIVEQVFQDRGMTDFEIRCDGSYPTVEFCVQYRESDLAFVQRLLENEGIFYFFEHQDDKHVLVIADANSKFEETPYQPSLHFRSETEALEEVVSSFQWHHAVHVGKVTLKDYDPLQPLDDFSASLAGQEEQEVYEYPGSYAKWFCNDPGDVAGQAERYARARLELEESRRHRALGAGNCRGIMVGYTFELTEHYREDANRPYVVTTLTHDARLGDYRTGRSDAFSYQCSFTVQDAATPYRPDLRTPRPVVQGTQTALVVGPKGEEIWTDKHGRVKCQFHWDREGQKDENSSCWIRVATPWGGKGYGSVSIPRIGNEVIVDFLEGDPDRPIIVGSVYNADQVPPNGLPDSGIQMGMKSRSSKGGGGYNEISVTDTKGEEVITIHGQFDMNTTVEHDMTETVNNNRTTNIAVDDSQTIGSNQVNDVGADRTTTIGGNEAVTVAADRTLSVGGNEDTDVGGAQSLTVGAARTTSIGANDELSVAANRTVEAGANMGLTAGANFTADAGVNAEVNAGGMIKVAAGATAEISAGATLKIQAGAMITLSAGGSTISIGPAGVSIQTGAIVSVMGSMIKLN